MQWSCKNIPGRKPLRGLSSVGTMVLLLPLLFLSLPAAPASAGVAVSPLQQQVTVRPGRTAEFTLTLNNVQRGPRTRAARVRVSLTDFAVSAEGALEFGDELRHERSAVPWTELDASEVLLRPGEKRTVRGTVSPPLDAEGDYWAVVMTTLDGPRDESGVNVVLRTASAVFVRVVRHTRIARPEIASVAVDLPSFAVEDEEGEDDRTALRVVAEVANDGLVGFIGDATATLYLDGRRQVAQVPLHSRRRRVLPGDRRIFEGVLAEPLPAGDYVARCVLAAEGEAGRRAFAEAEFSVSDSLAVAWKRVGAGEGPAGLKLNPELLELTLNPGRFTSFSVDLGNESGSTMRVQVNLEPGTVPEGWVALSPASFTLAPAMHRATVGKVRVPRDARPGDYRAAVRIAPEVGRLAEDAKPEGRTVEVLLHVVE
ncbi:MAG: hypothetical protein ACOC7S_00535 [Planctomycetota bacterium]